MVMVCTNEKKAISYNQKLMVVSGHAPDGYEDQVKSLGADWLNKPFITADLSCAVRALLDR